MVRTPSFDKNGMKKGTWTTEEDRLLAAYVTRYGCWNWRQLPKFAGLKRCGKSCRLRWMNYLRPNLKKGNYTKEEEEVIIRLHQSLGNKWSAIAAELPGRTDNEIKNHWHTHLKKRTTSSTRDHQGNHDRHRDPDDNDYANPQILGASDSPLVGASQKTSLSSDEVSTLTSDSLRTNASSTEIARTDSHLIDSNGDKPNLETFSQFTSDDFWTKPFLADSSYFNNNIDYFLSPALTEPEYFLSEFDPNYHFFVDSNFSHEHVQSYLL